jgi:hypothetical protein
MEGFDLKLGSTDLLFKGKKNAIKRQATRSCFSNELTFVLSGEIELITNLKDKYFKNGQSFHTHEQGA